MSRLEEETIGSKTIFQGKVVHLVVDDVRLPNGKTAKREIVKHPGAVAIIAVTENNKLLLVRQYRKPLDKVIFEIPAGKLEKDEDPDDCALRELEEETGYRSEKLEPIVTFYTSPGFSNELVHVYYTDTLIKGSQHLDPDEFLEVVEVGLDEALEMIHDRRIYDSKTVYAVQYLQMLALKQQLED